MGSEASGGSQQGWKEGGGTSSSEVADSFGGGGDEPGQGGATDLGVRKEVELAVRGGGARVSRQAGRGNPLLMRCFSCGDTEHVQRFYSRRGAVAVLNRRTGRC